MEDEYDIYGDLEGFEADAAKDNKVVHELKAQIAELRSQIAAKENEKQETITRNTVLLENISSLLVTAKAELKRKDAVIADIRRDRDNAAFRRTKPVHTHDQGTQTRSVRMYSMGVQTEEEGHHVHRVKKEKEVDWHWERKRAEEDHRRERDRFRVKERVPVRERLGNRGMIRQDMKQARGGRRGRDRATHEEEREREWQARHGPRSPDAERIRSAVRFRSPVRVKADDSSVPDSASDIELSRAFIPMNRKELDRYVKEIGRDQNRSPLVVEVTKQDKTSKPLDDVPKSDLWDTRPRKKTKTPKKHRKLANKTPIKQKSPKIIQSDEIGTTACGSNSLSPVKSEDIEQRMSALHGHPPLPEEPPELTIPPPEPPIIEHVPELPVEDDAKLNDSRELKIIESSDEQQQQQQQVVEAKGELVVEDEPNTSAETVIERTQAEEEDLEDGEIITPAPSPALPSKEEIAEAKRNAKIAKAVAQLAQETQETKSEPEQPIAQNPPKEKSTKPKRKRVEPLPPTEEVAIPAPKEPANPEQNKQDIKHKRNLNGAFELPTESQQLQQQNQRRNTFSGSLVANDKVKRKQRLSEPAAAEKVPKKTTETLQELFGSEDDDSMVVAPPKASTLEESMVECGAKRKRTESSGEGLDSKKRRSESVEIREDAVKKDRLVVEKKSGEVVVKEDDADVPKDEKVEEVAPENEIESESKEELESKSDSNISSDNTESSQNTEESNTTLDDSIASEAVLSDENKDVLESESVPEVSNESISDNEPATNGNQVPQNEIESVASHDEDQIDNSQKEEAPQDIASNDDEVKPLEGSHPQEVIVVSNKYCEYRIEEDNEAETTFFITRKKKKKSKSKSRNASLNASGAN